MSSILETIRFCSARGGSGTEIASIFDLFTIEIVTADDSEFNLSLNRGDAHK